MKLIGKTHNGNYDIYLFDDGTKIRENDLPSLIPEKPESMDIKITDYCDKGCPFCHENSTKNGKHGDIMNAKFFETLLPYTELALGGGNPLSHPDLINFLYKCKEKKLIPSMTINQVHFLENYDLIKKLSDENLIYGIGISLVYPSEDFKKKVKSLPNAVVHVINGIHSVETLEMLADEDIKLLILGYKVFRRGTTFYNDYYDGVRKDSSDLYKALPELVKKFKIVSFDNLALRQLNPRRFLSEEEWNTYYMGDDGTFTMYIDLVKNEFAVSSTSKTRFPLEDDIKPMFDTVVEYHKTADEINKQKELDDENY